MLSQMVFVAMASLASATAIGSVSQRSLVGLGGWSLSTSGAACPAGSATCFGNLTGNTMTEARGENCCPSGTTPRLDCGTYVNTGQPYACCPLSNPDCRGDVGKNATSDQCANSGWALWHIPEGNYNSFCCLPGQYGYYYHTLGQDAVGQCSDSSVLPDGATPTIQDNNGDGSVDADGNQVIDLPTVAPTPAPTCDIISKYGWSLQTADGTCTYGSSVCSYGGSSVGQKACCPTGLNCGTVVGDSEVPVCCPPSNPDCRGDVEGLWPQVCADSSWAMWHVNTNGNHFCCLPGQIGYNIINDNTAVGFCGSSVPNGTMRSILDYVGDGSTAGSFLEFPCDSSPAPNSSFSSMAYEILNPAATLNPFVVAAPTPKFANATATITYVNPALTVSLVSPDTTVAPGEVGIVENIVDGQVVTITSTNTIGVQAAATAVPTSSGSSSGSGTGTGSGSGSGSGSDSNTGASNSSTVTLFTGAANAVRAEYVGTGLAGMAVAMLFL